MDSLQSNAESLEVKTKKIIVLQDTRKISNRSSNSQKSGIQPIKLNFKQNLISGNTMNNANKTSDKHCISKFTIENLNETQQQQQIKYPDNILIASLLQINQEIHSLKNKIGQLQERMDSVEQRIIQTNNEKLRTKKQRRKFQDIVKNYHCLVEGCGKTYGSDVSLKLHIKLKHSGASENQNHLYKSSSREEQGQDWQLIKK